jgi:hypothetical protein
MVRSEGPGGTGNQLGTDHAGKGLEFVASAVRAAGALVRDDLKAGRFRAGGLSAPTVAWNHDGGSVGRRDTWQMSLVGHFRDVPTDFRRGMAIVLPAA